MKLLVMNGIQVAWVEIPKSRLIKANKKNIKKYLVAGVDELGFIWLYKGIPISPKTYFVEEISTLLI